MILVTIMFCFLGPYGACGTVQRLRLPPATCEKLLALENSPAEALADGEWGRVRIRIKCGRAP
jgi:hypothetical protein